MNGTVTEGVNSVVGIVAGALGGLAVGVEREWSGHASGPGAHFAGVRTFTLLGGLAAIAGWFWSAHYEILAALLLAGGIALVVAAYVAASRRSVDGTTEVAALVVLAAGVLAGTNQLVLASGIIAVTNLVLVEKSRLHAMVSRLDDAELRAGARFAVMAVVILPLLPPGPYGPLGGVRPRELWAFVLLFAGLSFGGYIARRVVGARQGYLVAGLLGGLISSTSVTFTFARASRGQSEFATPLAFGVIAASSVLFLRVLLATAILSAPVAVVLVRYVVPPFVVGVLVIVVGLRRMGEKSPPIEAPANPLEFWASLQMAALFQVVLFGVHLVRETWGQIGLLASGAVLGLADLDALTISMAKGVATGVSAETAARAIAIGIVSNTLVKMIVAAAIGRTEFRRLACAGLAVLGVATAVTLVLLW